MNGSHGVDAQARNCPSGCVRGTATVTHTCHLMFPKGFADEPDRFGPAERVRLDQGSTWGVMTAGGYGSRNVGMAMSCMDNSAISHIHGPFRICVRVRDVAAFGHAKPQSACPQHRRQNGSKVPVGQVFQSPWRDDGGECHRGLGFGEVVPDALAWPAPEWDERVVSLRVTG